MNFLTLLAGSALATIELTPKNFKDHVGGDKGAFVKFLAPW